MNDSFNNHYLYVVEKLMGSQVALYPVIIEPDIFNSASVELALKNQKYTLKNKTKEKVVLFFQTVEVIHRIRQEIKNK